MSVLSDEAICIRTFEYSETSQILTLLTREHGLIRVIAKGAHRVTKAGSSKFGGGIDLLDEGQALFTDKLEKELLTLTEWSSIEGHRDIRRSLRTIHLAMYACELIGNLFEQVESHAGLYERLRQMLLALPTPQREESALMLVLDVLRDSGYLPRLTRCTICNRSVEKEERVWFSVEHGGVVCRECEGGVGKKRSISNALVQIAVKLLRLPRVAGLPANLPPLARREVDPLHAMLLDHIEFTLGKRLRLRDAIFVT